MTELEPIAKSVVKPVTAREFANSQIHPSRLGGSVTAWKPIAKHVANCTTRVRKTRWGPKLEHPVGPYAIHSNQRSILRIPTRLLDKVKKLVDNLAINIEIQLHNKFIPVKSYRKAGIILQSKNSLLMVQGRESGLWSFPKGTREDSDTDYGHTAHRELSEETGVKITKADRVVGTYTFFRDQIYIHYKTSRYIKPYIKDTKEICNVRWVHKNDLTNNKKYKKTSVVRRYLRKHNKQF